MLTLSTTPNSAYLLHLAKYLLQSTTLKGQEILGLVRLADTKESLWGLRLQIASFLIANGKSDNAMDVIRGINVEKYICQSRASGELKLFYNVLLALDRVEEVSTLLESRDIDVRITDTDDFDIRIKTANKLIQGSQTSRAEKLLSKLNMERIYAENPGFTDGHAKIGWTLYWFQKDYAKAVEWMEKDLYPSASSDNNHSISRLSPGWRLNYAKVLAANGDIISAEEQVKIAYAESSDLKDGYSIISWLHFAQKEDFKSVIYWIKRDEDENRISSTWLLKKAIAVANSENIKAATLLVEKIYKKNISIQNVYTQIAWARYMSRDMAYEKILPYLKQDLQLGRLDGKGQLVYAQTLAMIGNIHEAEQIVEAAYESHPALKNGFAQIGFYSNFLFNYEPEKALKWFIRDQKKGRLHGEYIIHKATLLAATGDILSAESIVDTIYKEDSTAVNGYSVIGWNGYMVNKKNPEGALRMFERDQQLNRFKPKLQNMLGNTGNLLAGAYAYLGDRHEAERSLPLIGNHNKRIVGGHAIVGFCDYHRSQDLSYLKLMLDKEKLNANFDRPVLGYLYAAVLFRIGEKKKAKIFIRDAEKRSNLVSGLAKSWLERVAYNKAELKSEFISPELEEMLAKND